MSPNKLQGLYNENYKISSNEVKDNLTHWNIILCSLVGKLNIAKEAIHSKLIQSLSKSQLIFCRN